jgi:hypothetical protein
MSLSGRERHPRRVSVGPGGGRSEPAAWRPPLHLPGKLRPERQHPRGWDPPGVLGCPAGLGAEVEALLPVKSGAGHNPAGCFRAGLPSVPALAGPRWSGRAAGWPARGEARRLPPRPLSAQMPAMSASPTDRWAPRARRVGTTRRCTNRFLCISGYYDLNEILIDSHNPVVGEADHIDATSLVYEFKGSG